MNMADETISEKCETYYNKLNTFVKKVINRDVQPQIDDLESDVDLLNNSITNLVQIQSVTFSYGSLTINSTSTQTKTVKARPDGMNSVVITRIQNYCTIQDAVLNDTNLSLTVQNQSSGTHTCSATVLLVYFPSNWSI